MAFNRRQTGDGNLYQRNHCVSREPVTMKRLKGLIKRRILAAADTVWANRQKSAELSDTIIVSGVPRGGTTWFMEILATLPKYRMVFEPLNHVWFPILDNIDLDARPYLGADDHNPGLRRHLARTFAGRVASTSPHQVVTAEALARRVCANKVIVKFVRANNILPWIATNFDVKQIFFVIRHPCAVVESQMRTGITGYSVPVDVSLFPSGVGPSTHHFYGSLGRRSRDRAVRTADLTARASQIPNLRERNGLLNRLATLQTIEETLAASWCLDNYVPLVAGRTDLWHPIAYEELVLDGEQTLTTVFRLLGADVPVEAYAQLGAPSSTSKSHSVRKVKPLSLWKRSLTDTQIERIMRVVQWFDIECGGAESEPCYYVTDEAAGTQQTD